MAFYLDKHAVFYADQSCQFTLAFIDVGVFQHHRGLPVGARWDKRCVSFNLLQDALFFKYFFNSQHFLYLVTNRSFALKLQIDMLAQLHAT